MDNCSQDEVSSIINYVKSAKLKGSVDVGEEWFWWNLGDVELYFCIDKYDTTVSYFRNGHKTILIGHFHVDNSEVVKLVQDINCESKMVQITASVLFSSFSIINKTDKKKKSWFLCRRYYSC